MAAQIVRDCTGGDLAGALGAAHRLTAYLRAQLATAIQLGSPADRSLVLAKPGRRCRDCGTPVDRRAARCHECAGRRRRVAAPAAPAEGPHPGGHAARAGPALAARTVAAAGQARPASETPAAAHA
jgi:hypothetical protein